MRRVAARWLLIIFGLCGAWGVARAQGAGSAAPGVVAPGQTDDSVASLKARVDELVKQQKYTEALPLLEKMVAASPNDALAFFNLGFSYLAKAQITADAGARKALRVKAHNSFVRAKELHVDQPVVDAMIQAVPADGSESGGAFSQNAQANALMNEAEGFFATGKGDEALADYQKALELDPKLYEAALYSGDVYSQRGDYANAEIAYLKAIAINPQREIAYRYSATPLMKQKKHDEAKLRYVEAYVVEPYSKFSQAGMSQWAQATHTGIGHVKIDIPVTVTIDALGAAKVNMDASALTGKDDGSSAWILYGGVRIEWNKGKFLKTYPNERVYRHSLAEEAEALRTVLSMAKEDKKVKTLSPALTALKKLDDAGMLEAYILMARADEGIAQDYPDYLKANREKLRKYVMEFVIQGAGN